MKEAKASKFNHTFTIIDNMMTKALADAKEEGKKASCRKGCTHCCSLLVEISREEAQELATWVMNLPERKKTRFLIKIDKAAKDARDLFNSRPKWTKYAEGWDYETELPDAIYDQYFYQKDRPCPFLDRGACASYEVRPVPCRLHVVSSSPRYCKRDIHESKEYEVPKEVEEMQDETAPIMYAMAKDGRWGQLSILTHQVLTEMGAYKNGNFGSMRAA